MRTPEQWDELLTCSPMSAQEALRSVRVKPAEIKAIQTDARADLLERIKALELENARLLNLVSAEALTQYHVALERCAVQLNDLWLWQKRAIQDLKYKDTTTTTSTGAVNANGFSYAEIPDWELRQKLEETEQALALATPLIEKGRK